MFYASYDFGTLSLIAAIALLLNFLLTVPGMLQVAVTAPRSLWAGIILKLSEKLNRFRRDDRTRRMRGLALVLLVVAVMWLLGALLTKMFLWDNKGVFAEIILLALLLDACLLFTGSRQIGKLLKKAPQTISAAVLPPRLVRRQQQEYDAATVLRGAIEAMMVGFSERVIAPILFYLLLGWPGMLVVLAVTGMDGLLGYRNPQHARFGTATAHLHTLLQWIPARITGMLLCFAAWFAPACRPLAALRIMLTQADRAASRNSGWPIAAAAGALGATLGGPRAMFGSYIGDQWIGEGSAKIDARSLKAAQGLFLVSMLLLIMCLLIAGAA